MYHSFQTILSSIIVFNIDDNTKKYETKSAY